MADQHQGLKKRIKEILRDQKVDLTIASRVIKPFENGDINNGISVAKQQLPPIVAQAIEKAVSDRFNRREITAKFRLAS